jgi:hypothetical protein
VGSEGLRRKNEKGMSDDGEHSRRDGVAPVSDRRTRQSATGATLERRQWRQLAVISVAALAIYITLRLLPTGTNLNHMDFRVQGKNSIEFCDPLNPQFIPVVAARSPVTLTVSTEHPAHAGEPVRGVLTLRTSGGKPIAPEDLLVVHEKPLHLMLVDPSLTDYQHVHPQPTATKGEWTFSFLPRFGGTYRLFADFTPVATGRGLYANTDLVVSGTAAEPRPEIRTAAKEEPSAAPRRGVETPPYTPADNVAFAPVEQEGYRFTLTPTKPRPRAREPIDLTFTVASASGVPVPMQPIMGAYAHLVAFDSDRSGFAHLHPDQSDPLQKPDAMRPTLKFKLTIPSPGRYVIWSQVNLDGHEVFAPFWFTVVSADGGN